MSAVNTLSFPPYKGSTLRGAFGHTFRRVSCSLHKQNCGGCMLNQRCVYSYVFETPPPDDAGMAKKYSTAPHPFIILPPLEKKRLYRKDEPFSFSLTLIGRAGEYLPYFIYTLNELGKSGIGRGNGTFMLRKVTKADTREEIYNGNGKISSAAHEMILWDELVKPENGKTAETKELTLSFQTPTRIKYREDLVLDLEFHILMRCLLRRIANLSYFHCGTELDVDFKGLISDAENIEVESSGLQWYDWERYSSRQGTRMKLGGFVGDITFTGDIAKFLPFIILGEHIHLGKGTSFGLGKYAIAANDLPGQRINRKQIRTGQDKT